MMMPSTRAPTGLDLPSSDHNLATQTNLIDEFTQELSNQVAKMETIVTRIAGAVPREVPAGIAKQNGSSPTNLVGQLGDIKNRLRWALNDLGEQLLRLDSAIG